MATACGGASEPARLETAPPPRDDGAAEAASPASTETPELPDEDVAAAIASLLDRAAELRDAELEVNVLGGIAILNGTTQNLRQSWRAADLAKAAMGVRAVVNRVTVDVPERDDRRLLRDVQHALAAHPATDPWEIDAEVSDGIVTLEGTVDTLVEERLIERVVAEVRGVKEIRGAVVVEHSPEARRSDAELEAVIEGRLAHDVRVEDDRIEVDVDDGNATILGEVASVWERDRIIELASIQGIRTIDVFVDIEWWRTDALRDGRPATSNEEVVEALQTALFFDPRVPEETIDVVAARGVVTLSGTVPTIAARNAAVRDAANTVGVERVDVQMTVEPPEAATDERLVRDVRAALQRSPHTELAEIDVTADGGAVVIAGEVDSPFERLRAEEIAGGIVGVITVDNQLVVDAEVAAIADTALKQNIDHALRWNPYVDADGVEVSVADGVAVLSGSVGSTRARLAAVETAYALGAANVVTRLNVRGAPTPAASDL